MAAATVANAVATTNKIAAIVVIVVIAIDDANRFAALIAQEFPGRRIPIRCRG
jgi:uncharacterized membrane protein YqjE